MSSTSSSTASDAPAKPPGPARLPSLNQLAARMSATANKDGNAAGGANSAPSPSANRPRLAAFALRTNSNTSLSTTVSTADSLAVNPPQTRSGSPSAFSDATASPQEPNDDTPYSVSGGEALTAEKLEKLNSVEPLEKKPRVGYKNIPSLDAITARMAKTRTLSIDGSAKPPEPEMIEDPKTPGFAIKAPEHPLQYTWSIFHDTKSKFNPQTPAPVSAAADVPFPGTPASATGFSAESQGEYEAGLTHIGEFSTVEEFCRYLNWLKPPSKLEKNSNYHLFKSGIKPMWEDPANADGGKWVLTMKNSPALLDRCWNWLAMALVGEELEEGGNEITGAVVSLRSKVDRIQVWTRSKDDVEKLNAIGKKMVKLLDVSEADGINLEFQFNNEDRPMPNKFLSIQSVPTSTYRSNFHPSPTVANGDMPSPGGNGGAFGSFGVGGLGGSGWRGGRRGGG